MKKFTSIISYLLIILWVYAAVVKLADYPAFTGQLKVQPLPEWSLPFLSKALPLGEIGLAVLLLFRKTINLGLLLSFILMLCFTVYVLLALSGAFGAIPCACAGIIGKLPWKEHLIFNIFFTATAYTGWRSQRHSKGGNFVKHKPLAT